MAVLPTRSFATIVQTFSAGVQGRANAILDFALGSVLRALGEAVAGIALWLQAMILQLLTTTRAATSQMGDLDTWVGDFGLTRLGSQAGGGLVTFARFTAGPSAPFVPVGSLVQTSDGTQQFAVTSSPANVNYSAALSGYTLSAQVLSMQVPVAAIVSGAAGNVAAGTASVSASALPGIDTVTNLAAFTGGCDQESDAALRTRFQNYILGLSRGDLYGTQAALQALQISIQDTIVENTNIDGSFHAGYYYVTADDGSGNPPASFMTSVAGAVNAVRPLGVQAVVFPPVVVAANIAMQITTANGFDHNSVIALVAAALGATINGLGLGNGLPFSLLYSTAMGVSGVVSVQAVTLNGNSGDAASIVGTPRTSIKPTSIVVS